MAPFSKTEIAQPRTPDGEKPAIEAPIVIWCILLSLILIHVMRSFLPVNDEYDFMLIFSFIPARLTAYLDPGKMQEIWEIASITSAQQMVMTQYILAQGSALWTILTHTFLHGSWMHLVFNALWLLAFGTPVARRFGSWRFLILFGLCGATGALFFWFIHPNSLALVVGASGAVSGIMAIAIRFIFIKKNISFNHQAQTMIDAPLRSLFETFMNKQSVSFIIIWFALNFVSGVAPAIIGIEGAIAWEAHIGGFVTGLLIAPLFDSGTRNKPKNA